MFMSVDLPEPEGPTTATYSLAPISRSTPRSASTSMRPIVYTLRIRASRSSRRSHHSYLSDSAGLTLAARRAGK